MYTYVIKGKLHNILPVIMERKISDSFQFFFKYLIVSEFIFPNFIVLLDVLL